MSWLPKTSIGTDSVHSPHPLASTNCFSCRISAADSWRSCSRSGQQNTKALRKQTQSWRYSPECEHFQHASCTGWHLNECKRQRVSIFCLQPISCWDCFYGNAKTWRTSMFRFSPFRRVEWSIIWKAVPTKHFTHLIVRHGRKRRK